MSKRLARIGVFVCHCGLNIAGTVDVQKVVAEIRKYPGVVYAEHYMYMCSDPGQELMRKAIREYKLDGIVNANCSPSLHERTFRKIVASEGMNPYLCEIANIREQCSWPHSEDKETATKKAIAIIKTTIERLRSNTRLTPLVIPLTKRALVVGAGIAGVQSALDIANSGYEVVLVEKEASLGGHVMELARTFPTMECPADFMKKKLGEIISHPNIKLYPYSEIEGVSGYVGNFTVTVRRKAQFIDRQKCTGCGLCVGVCPVSVPSEFDRGLSQRKAIYLPRYGVREGIPLIDTKTCLYFQDGSCRKCQEVCPEGTVDFTQTDAFVEEEIGAVIAAPGFELLSREKVPQFPDDPDIIDGLQFERMLSSDGPTGGKILRPSDKRTPQDVVFIQCAGSRDPEHGMPYCSRVCCMYTAKQVELYRQAVPDGQAYVCYMDIRSDAKGFEEFVQQVMSSNGILYIRGNTSRIFRDGDKIKVWTADTLTGKSIEIAADMVVLALAMVPRDETRELARKLNISLDAQGFFTEAHIKLRPVESLTSGMYLAGTAQWPRDIPDTITSASAAASKIISLFSRKELLHEPTTAHVDEEVCSGCGICVNACTYKAISMDEKKKIAVVNEALCEGCGACAATCPSKAMQHNNWTHRQLLAMIDVAGAGYV